jgi:hypothetical protein
MISLWSTDLNHGSGEAKRSQVAGDRLRLRFPSLSFRVDLTGHCAEGGESEVLMQVTRSLAARIRKWLGALGRKPSKLPYGAGAWGR